MRKLFQFDHELAKHPIAKLIIISLSLALCAYWLLYPAKIALLMPDSSSYIDFQDYRGAGYPAFLALLRFLGLNIEHIPIIQNLLFFIALAFLGISFNNRFKSLGLSLALLIGIGMNPAITRFNFSIITESVYFSSLFIFLGLILRINYKRTSSGRIKRPLNYVLLGVLFAWLVLIKPVSWSFIAVPVFIVWQHLSLRQNIARSLTMILFGFICIHILGASYRYTVHEQFSAGSFFGNQLIGKLAFTSFDPNNTPYPEAGKLWLEIMQPSHQARQRLEKHSEKFLFALNTYDFLRFDNMPDIVEAMQSDDPKSAQKDLALAVLQQNPKSYAYDVGLNFLNLWAIGELQTKSFSVAYNKKLDHIVANFKDDIPRPYYLNEDGSLQVIIIKPLLALIAILNILLVIIGILYILRLKPQGTAFNQLFIMACSINAYFFLTALLQAALTRYAIVAWPMHLILLFGLIALLRAHLFLPKQIR